MQDILDEACEAVQAAAAGKSRAAIRRMLMAEFRARDVSLPPPLFDVAVKQIAAGTYVSGEPLVSVRRSGLLSLPFIGKAIGRRLEPALEALREHIAEEGVEHGVARVTEHVADAWPVVSGTLPRPPGRDLFAPAPEDVPPPARLIPDPDLRERIPELFEAPPPPPKWTGMPPSAEAELVFAWLEESGGTVAVCCQPGRIGILDAGDAEAYLPLVRSAHAQGKVVAATADIRVTAGGLLPATVRVVPDRSGQGGRSDEFPDDLSHGLDLPGGRGSRGLAGIAAGRAG
ncbi:MAG TPA: hypothetical protein VFQ68_23915 [Streptosporangiaceae bacterium]|nr:hypothetical protein [Streptosporangiaceae bacterium]